MPDKVPPPISAEGRRAAGNIRSIFMFIVAANLAIVAIVFWGRPSSRDDAGAREAMVRMERVIENSIAAYNAGDGDAFLKLFATSAAPPADGEFFTATIEGNYKREFGIVAAKTLIPAMTVATGTGGTLVCDLQCEQGRKAKLIAKFVSEMDEVKLVEWRMVRQ